MLLLASLACVPTAVYGIRLDGSMPRNTEVSVVGGVFPEFAEDGSDASVAGLSGDDGVGADLGTDTDIVTWGMMVQAGASFREGEAPTPR